jgi:hypothetical protein
MIRSAYRHLFSLDAHTTTHTVRIALGCAIALYMLGGYYLIGYYSAQGFAVGTLTPLAFWTAADAYIPLVPAFVFPYLLYIPVLISPGLLPLRFGDFIEGCTGYLAASSLAFAFFLVMPVRMEYPILDCAGLACAALLAGWFGVVAARRLRSFFAPNPIAEHG